MNLIALRLTLVFVLVLLGGCGFTGNLKGDPGFAAFDSPGLMATDRVIALSLGPVPLRLARIILDEDEDPEAAMLLKELDAVRVYVYEIDRSPALVKQRMDSTAKRLQESGWQPVVAVRGDGELVRVMFRMQGDELIRGMVVMVQDDEELVLINLIGDLRPELFNSYMSELDIEAPAVEIEGPQSG
jgi:hypothetical protein